MAKDSRSGSMTDTGEDVAECLEDARRLIRDLRERTRTQAQQLLAWRRAYKMQEVLISRLHREKADQLKTLSSKLLLFESRLIRKQKDISVMLNQREMIIHRQQRIIETLTNRLIDNGLEPPITDIPDFETNLLDLESLNDSDSAVVMEDVDSDSNFTHIPKYRNPDGITVVRSISDAIDPNLKYTIRRTNGFLRRPEILETVYSVEEDADDSNDAKTEANKKRDAFASGSGRAIVNEEPPGRSIERTETLDPPERPENTEKLQRCDKTDKIDQLADLGQEITWQECLLQAHDPDKPPNQARDKDEPDQPKQNGGNQVTTYNRVMSNHRSVTKPKDVKYKRINKAKSKSLEELRGRLKNWVEQGSKLTGLSLEHSQSYA